MKEFIENFETNLEEAAVWANFMCSASTLSWHLVRGAKLSGLQRLLLMNQVYHPHCKTLQSTMTVDQTH